MYGITRALRSSSTLPLRVPVSAISLILTVIGRLTDISSVPAHCLHRNDSTVAKSRDPSSGEQSTCGGRSLEADIPVSISARQILVSREPLLSPTDSRFPNFAASLKPVPRKSWKTRKVPAQPRQ